MQALVRIQNHCKKVNMKNILKPFITTLFLSNFWFNWDIKGALFKNSKFTFMALEINIPGFIWLCNQCLCLAYFHSLESLSPTSTIVHNTMTVWIRMAFFFAFQYTISFWPITNVQVFWQVFIILAPLAFLRSYFFLITKVCKI